MKVVEIYEAELAKLRDEVGQIASIIKPIKLYLALLHYSMNPQSSRMALYLQSEEAYTLILRKEEIKAHLEDFLLTAFDDINHIYQSARAVEQYLGYFLATDINFDRESTNYYKNKYIETPNAAYKAQIARLQAILRGLATASGMDREVRPETVVERCLAKIKGPQVFALSPLPHEAPPVYLHKRTCHVKNQLDGGLRAQYDCALYKEKNTTLLAEITALKAYIAGREAYLKRELVRELKNAVK